MTISHYRAERDSERGRRITIDLSRTQVVLGIVLALIAIAGSAATGVLATAHAVVPPIAIEAIKPALDRLAAEDLRNDQAIAKVERDGAVRDADNMQAMRQQMAELQTQLRETSRVMSEFLLSFARSNRR
jgi:uncharacterized lipoprotein YajG